jgi:hypothetical protein
LLFQGYRFHKAYIAKVVSTAKSLFKNYLCFLANDFSIV